MDRDAGAASRTGGIMRKFLLGIVFALLVLTGGVLAFLRLGFMPTTADATPSALEAGVADSALDASIERHAPRTPNPVPPTDGNLIDGMKIYAMNCALCHGGFDEKPSALAHALYPPPPQLVLDPLDDPEWHTFYAISRGVRYTGMPAWRATLSEQDMWKVTALLSRVEKLPPGVRDYWKNAFGTVPPGGGAPDKTPR
jgi:thiosulfate dehydrogenase